MKAVKLDSGKWNYLKDDGTYLLDENVYFCCNFYEGFGIVEYDDDTYTYNLVNLEGKKFLKKNVEYTRDFYNGFAFLVINDIWYIIDTECNFYDSNKISFKELYRLYPQKRQELIEIIKEYTYFDVNEYFNI